MWSLGLFEGTTDEHRWTQIGSMRIICAHHLHLWFDIDLPISVHRADVAGLDVGIWSLGLSEGTTDEHRWTMMGSPRFICAHHLHLWFDTDLPISVHRADVAGLDVGMWSLGLFEGTTDEHRWTQIGSMRIICAHHLHLWFDIDLPISVHRADVAAFYVGIWSIGLIEGTTDEHDGQ